MPIDLVSNYNFQPISQKYAGNTLALEEKIIGKYEEQYKQAEQYNALTEQIKRSIKPMEGVLSQQNAAKESIGAAVEGLDKVSKLPLEHHVAETQRLAQDISSRYHAIQADKEKIQKTFEDIDKTNNTTEDKASWKAMNIRDYNNSLNKHLKYDPTTGGYNGGFQGRDMIKYENIPEKLMAFEDKVTKNNGYWEDDMVTAKPVEVNSENYNKGYRYSLYDKVTKHTTLTRTMDELKKIGTQYIKNSPELLGVLQQRGEIDAFNVTKSGGLINVLDRYNNSLDKKINGIREELKKNTVKNPTNYIDYINFLEKQKVPKDKYSERNLSNILTNEYIESNVNNVSDALDVHDSKVETDYIKGQAWESWKHNTEDFYNGVKGDRQTNVFNTGQAIPVEDINYNEKIINDRYNSSDKDLTKEYARLAQVLGVGKGMFANDIIKKNIDNILLTANKLTNSTGKEVTPMNVSYADYKTNNPKSNLSQEQFDKLHQSIVDGLDAKIYSYNDNKRIKANFDLALKGAIDVLSKNKEIQELEKEYGYKVEDAEKMLKFWRDPKNTNNGIKETDKDFTKKLQFANHFINLKDKILKSNPEIFKSQIFVTNEKDKDGKAIISKHLGNAEVAFNHQDFTRETTYGTSTEAIIRKDLDIKDGEPLPKLKAVDIRIIKNPYGLPQYRYTYEILDGDKKGEQKEIDVDVQQHNIQDVNKYLVSVAENAENTEAMESSLSYIANINTDYLSALEVLKKGTPQDIKGKKGIYEVKPIGYGKYLLSINGEPVTKELSEEDSKKTNSNFDGIPIQFNEQSLGQTIGAFEGNVTKYFKMISK